MTPPSTAKLTSLTATTDPKNFDTALTAIMPVSGDRRRGRGTLDRNRWREGRSRWGQPGHRAITSFE